MEPWQELLATSHRQTLEFFAQGLRDVCDDRVDQRELLYNASVLAHYAQVSTQAAVDLPAPTHLGAVFDHFVWSSALHQDPAMLEAAGAQCLLLAGFFEDQMRQRHNIRWYSSLGAAFFSHAAAQQTLEPKARLLATLARHFEPWRQRHARLGRELRVQVYLVRPHPPAGAA